LEIESQPINPLPNKFLVPFLEKASLEELDSIILDRWADLLACCSANPALAHPRFVQILSELNAEEAQLLRRIALNNIDAIPPEEAYCPGFFLSQFPLGRFQLAVLLVHHVGALAPPVLFSFYLASALCPPDHL
jgi:hypothetical protein